MDTSKLRNGSGLSQQFYPLFHSWSTCSLTTLLNLWTPLTYVELKHYSREAVQSWACSSLLFSVQWLVDLSSMLLQKDGSDPGITTMAPRVMKKPNISQMKRSWPLLSHQSILTPIVDFNFLGILELLSNQPLDSLSIWILLFNKVNSLLFYLGLIC